MANYILSDLFSAVEKIKLKKDRIEYLQNHNSLALRDILKCAFDDSIIFDMPEGPPPYNEWNKESHPPSSLHAETQKLRFLVKQSDTPPAKKEIIFIGILESIDSRDAKILIAAKDKSLKVKGITKKLVMEAFPGLISQ
jgi:hypothetical protein